MRKFENPEFLALRAEGKNNAQIAERFGCKPATVEGWVGQAVKAGLIPSVRWPEERTERLKELYESGVHVRDIARELGVTEQAVQGKINSGRLRRKDARHWTQEKIDTLRKFVEEGKSSSWIANLWGMATHSIENARRKHGIAGKATFWTKERTDTLIRLWNQGNGGAHIAHVLGCSRGSAEGKIDRLGFPRDRGYPIQRAKATRSYDHLQDPEVRRKANETRRANLGLKPAPTKKADPVADNVIPLHARPWLTRKREECAYPFGEKGNIHSCCQPVFGGTVYCEEHAGLCYSYEGRKKLA